MDLFDEDVSAALAKLNRAAREEGRYEEVEKRRRMYRRFIGLDDDEEDSEEEEEKAVVVVSETSESLPGSTSQNAARNDAKKNDGAELIAMIEGEKDLNAGDLAEWLDNNECCCIDGSQVSWFELDQRHLVAVCRCVNGSEGSSAETIRSVCQKLIVPTVARWMREKSFDLDSELPPVLNAFLTASPDKLESLSDCLASPLAGLVQDPAGSALDAMLLGFVDSCLGLLPPTGAAAARLRRALVASLARIPAFPESCVPVLERLANAAAAAADPHLLADLSPCLAAAAARGLGKHTAFVKVLWNLARLVSYKI